MSENFNFSPMLRCGGGSGWRRGTTVRGQCINGAIMIDDQSLTLKVFDDTRQAIESLELTKG